jgi:hypothetical protein
MMYNFGEVEVRIWREKRKINYFNKNKVINYICKIYVNKIIGLYRKEKN